MSARFTVKALKVTSIVQMVGSLLGIIALMLPVGGHPSLGSIYVLFVAPLLLILIGPQIVMLLERFELFLRRRHKLEVRATYGRWLIIGWACTSVFMVMIARALGWW